MSRIDPQFGPDFIPGFRPDYSPDYSAFGVLPQDPHPDYPSDFNLEDEKTRTALGIINGVCISVVAWAFIAAIVLLAWGI
jgi:hypothetical protein